ncbi:lipopolysaccharide biosynthesis protein [Phreatobacter aquaticus]|uniref:lipopolysaccharide biosynthesis protein n=1 Tax=Phreatobacter aquaticus TaxID=2570229 RepID=UPI00143E0394|nr:hypothetical protein [Phreatobacter aquaticus]
MTLVATPAIVHGLGPNAYGAYSIVVAIVAFAVMPPSQAAVAKFTASKSVTLADMDGLLLRILAVQMVAVAANVLLVGLVDRLVGINLPSDGGAQHVLFLASFAVWLIATAMIQVFSGALQYLGHWRLAAGVLLLTGCTYPLVGVVLVLLGTDWLVVVAGQAAAALVGSVVMMGFYRSVAPSGGGPVGSPPALPTIAGFLLRTGIAAGIGSVMALAERLFLAARFGPESAGRFAVAMSLAMLIHGLMQSANLRLPQLLSSALRQGGRSDMEAIYRFAMRLTLAATALVMTLVLALGERFLLLWLGQEFGSNVVPLLPWLAVAMSGLAVAVPVWMLADVAGQERLNIALMAGLMLAWAICAAILVPRQGADGIALARLSVPFCVAIYVVAVEFRVFGAFAGAFWALTMLRCGLVAAMTFALATHFAPHGWSGLVATAFASVAVNLVAGLLTGLLRPLDLEAKHG